MQGLLVTATAGAIGPTQADPLPAEFEIIEVMKEAIGADMQGIARILGIDETANLELTTFTDPVALGFGYSLGPDASYQGQSLTLDGFGLYNPAMSRWEGQGTITTGGGETWTGAWTSDVLSADPYVAHMDWVTPYDPLGWGWPDYHGSWIVEQDENGDFHSYFEGIMTLGGEEVGRVRIPDETFCSTGDWTWDGEFVPDPGYGDAFYINGVGTSPVVGGTGESSYVMTVPEPGSLSLLALAALATVRRRRP